MAAAGPLASLVLGLACFLVMLPLPIPYYRRYDITRAAEELGWRNRPFVDALRETFAREAGAS